MLYRRIRHHPSHPHHDLLLEYSSEPVICDGCREVGFGLRFACNACDHHLHQVCARPPGTIRCTVYMPTVTFEFCDTSPCRGTLCNACGSGIEGYFYRGAHGRFLHPVCAELPQVVDYGGARMRLKVQMLAECSWCMTDGDGEVSTWSYVSSSGARHLHVACVKEMLVATWEREHLGGDRAVPVRSAPLLTSNRYTSTLQLTSVTSSSSSSSSSSSFTRSRQIVLRPQSSNRPLMVGGGSSNYRNLVWEKVMEFLRELPWEVVRSLVGDPKATVADYVASVMRRWASRRLLNHANRE